MVIPFVKVTINNCNIIALVPYAAQERKNECVQSVDKDQTQLKRIFLIHQIGCQI